MYDSLASQSRSGVSSFYGYDSQLSARLLTSILGVITDVYGYTAFGIELQSGSGTINPFRYGAQAAYYRVLADLINAWHRWLKASIGRWNSADPIGFDGGSWSLYPYVGNMPTLFVDPAGLQVWYPPHQGRYNPDVPDIQFKSCSKEEKSRVRAAIKDLCTIRQTYIKNHEAREQVIWMCMSTVTVVCVPEHEPKCHQNGIDDCSYASADSSDTIHLCPKSFTDPICGCLEKTLMWEMINNYDHPTGKDSPLAKCSYQPFGPGYPPCPK